MSEAPVGRVLLILATITVAAVTGPAAAQSADQAEIRSVAMRQNDTWNRHDAKAYAALFTEDCDVVSRLTITEVHTRFIRPDVAVAHARWTMVGARTPAGIPEPREGIQTLVFTKQSGRWLIAAFQNTHSVPERPFPSRSGKASAPDS
jgi:ketosteroid isomerase-like protein